MADEKQILGQDEVITEAKDTLERVNSWISLCDTKTGIVLGIFGVAYTIMVSTDGIKNYKNLIQTMWKSSLGTVFTVILILSVVAIAVGTFSLILTLVPKTDSKLFKESYINTRSKIFFGTISQYVRFKDYKDKFSHMRRQDYINDLLSQVFINSKIANQKYTTYKFGLLVSLLGFGAFIVLSIISFSIFM